MSLARTVFFSVACCAVIGAMLLPGGLRAQEGLRSELREAEERLEERVEHLAHTDPTHVPADAEPLPFDQDLALWTAVVFLLLLAVLWKFAWGPILAGLEKREHSIEHDIDDAKRQKSEADSLVAKYEARLAAAGDEVRAILDEARRNAEGVKQSILAEAKQGAEAERMRSLHEIENATDAALRSLAERSAQLAVDLAGKIVRHNLTTADHARLVNEAVEKFAAAPSKN